VFWRRGGRRKGGEIRGSWRAQVVGKKATPRRLLLFPAKRGNRFSHVEEENERDPTRLIEQESQEYQHLDIKPSLAPLFLSTYPGRKGGPEGASFSRNQGRQQEGERSGSIRPAGGTHSPSLPSCHQEKGVHLSLRERRGKGRPGLQQVKCWSSISTGPPLQFSPAERKDRLRTLPPLGGGKGEGEERKSLQSDYRRN